MIHLCKRRFAAQPQFYCLDGIAAIANAGMVHRDIRMVGKGCTRMVQTRGARPGVSLLSAKRGEAIGKSWNSYRRDVLYAIALTGFLRISIFASDRSTRTPEVSAPIHRRPAAISTLLGISKLELTH